MQKEDPCIEITTPATHSPCPLGHDSRELNEGPLRWDDARACQHPSHWCTARPGHTNNVKSERMRLPLYPMHQMDYHSKRHFALEKIASVLKG